MATTQMLRSCSRSNVPSSLQVLAGLAGSRPAVPTPVSFSQALAGVFIDGGPFQPQQSASFSTGLCHPDKALQRSAEPSRASTSVEDARSLDGPDADGKPQPVFGQHGVKHPRTMQSSSHLPSGISAARIHAEFSPYCTPFAYTVPPQRPLPGLCSADAMYTTLQHHQSAHLSSPRGSFNRSHSVGHAHTAAGDTSGSPLQQSRPAESDGPRHDDLAALVQQGQLDAALKAMKAKIAEGTRMPTGSLQLLISKLCQAQRPKVRSIPHAGHRSHKFLA